jgi:anthranilate phosphoribosyltransferase
MIYTIKDGIDSLLQGQILTREQSEQVMFDIMSGKANDVQISAYLTALRIRGETPEIITGAAISMRKFATSIAPLKEGLLVDTCGTGGDNSCSFNISTISALVVAGAGGLVAKHGNRSVTSKCGSADLLEGFGVNISIPPIEVEKIINEIGIGFLFAPVFHPAMKYAMPTRKRLGIRTIFNILGPLTNPANARAHVLGVFDKNLVETMAQVMLQLNAEHVYVVNSDPGIDEIVPITNVNVAEVVNNQVKTYTLTPKDFGIRKVTLESLKVNSLDENLSLAIKILKNIELGTKRKIVVINAAYALMACNMAKDFKTAVEMAEESLTSEKALKKLEQLVIKTGGSLDKFNQLVNS